MKISKDFFYEHELTITNDIWKIDLFYESSRSKKLRIKPSKDIPILPIVDNDKFYSAIKINATRKGVTKNCILTGIDGAFILHNLEKNNEGQTVMIHKNNIILSIGFTLVSINLENFRINWKIRPDPAEIFEFYKYERDIILRGELDIHRINIESGKVLWRFHGNDVWINVNGKEEIRLNKNNISLYDWNDTYYLIDYNGKLIKSQKKLIYRKVFFKSEPKLWLLLIFKELIKVVKQRLFVKQIKNE